MKLLLNLENTEMFEEIVVEPTDTLESLIYLVEASFSIEYSNIQLLYNEKIVSAKLNATINSLGFEEDSIIVVRKAIKKAPTSNVPKVEAPKQNASLSSIFDDTMKILKTNKDDIYQRQAKAEAEVIYNRCMIDSGELSILFNTDEKLAEAVSSGSIKAVEELILKRILAYNQNKEKEKLNFEKLVRSNSNDPEAQKKIEEYIHRQQIEENKQFALEHFPESVFSQHHMLYIPLEINKFKVIALVDTGAQMTIMSVDIAHKCGLYHLIDTNYKGKAIGVGESNIIGVVHCAQIKVGNNHIMAKITVIENVSIGFILGLDNMRSHRCVIELATNSLKFPDAGFHINFLSDGDCKKLKSEHEQENSELLKQNSNSK